MRNVVQYPVRQSAPVDVTNDFGVGVQGSLIVMTRPPGRGITRQAALRLAAHLVAQADGS